MARHKWNRKITKKDQWCECIICGVVKEVQYPFGYVYFSKDGKMEYIKAPKCIDIIK